MGFTREKVDSSLNMTFRQSAELHLMYFLAKASRFFMASVSRSFLAALLDGRPSFFWSPS